MNCAAVTTRQTKRADEQRDRILCAALRCFIEHGFHAASMANIADTAQMSAGLMYRYFANKNAIVLAIIERQLEEKRCRIRMLQSSGDMTSALLEAFDHWCTGERSGMKPALFLEMSAEATRDPQIAAALRESDGVMREEFDAWFRRDAREGGLGFPPEVAAARALQLQFVVEGLVLRAVREPGIDRARLDAAIRESVDRILAP